MLYNSLTAGDRIPSRQRESHSPIEVETLDNFEFRLDSALQVEEGRVSDGIVVRALVRALNIIAK